MLRIHTPGSAQRSACRVAIAWSLVALGLIGRRLGAQGAPLATAPAAIAASAPHAATAPDPPVVQRAVANYRAAHEPDIVRELAQLVATPNLASDAPAIRQNATIIINMLRRRGIAARLLETAAGGPPAVYGELTTPGAARTVVLYAHYDGQPVDAAKWATPPWQPTLRDGPAEAGGRVVPIPGASGVIQPEWRLYGRSAADDKGPIVAMLSALDALRAGGISPGVNLKFYFDGEEEAGDAHITAMLRENRALLASDGWIFADGPMHQSRRAQVLFGARGVTDVVITTYGATRALHSGHYGNWAPNPAVVMANFIASLRDDDGHVRIRDFYADVRPLSASDRRALKTIPVVDSALRAELGLGATEAHDALLAERIMQPALNVRSLHAGPVGAAANAIPTEASASIDFRLVPSETPAHIRELMEAHARRLGFTVLHSAPDSATRMAHAKLMRFEWGADGYSGLRTRTDDPFAHTVVRSVTLMLGAPVIEVPMLGGSLPLALFSNVLHAPVVVLPIANHDDNQHASNENLRMQNLFDGVLVFAGVIAGVGAAK